MMNRLLFRFAFIFLPTIVFAQKDTTIDSLIRRTTLSIPDTEKVNCYNRIADVSKDSLQVLGYALKAIDLAKKSDFKKGEGNAYVVLGNFFSRKQINFVKSVRYYTAALAKRTEINDAKGMAQCDLQLAIIDGRFKNSEKAIALLRKAEALNSAINNTRGLKSDYQVMAQLFMNPNQFDSSLFYFRKAAALGQNNIVATAINDINLVSVFVGLKQFDSAMHYIHITDSIYHNVLHNEFGVLWDKMSIGQIALLQGDVKKAIFNLRPAYDYGDSTHNGDLLLNVLPVLIDAYRKDGNSAEGFRLQTQWIQLNDSLKDVDKANAVLSQQIQYDEDEQKKIDQLVSDQKEKEHQAEVNRQQLVIYSVSAILLLALGMVFFIYRNYREKKKANETISLQKMIVEEKQKEIIDSINYASRIQRSLLPTDSRIEKALKKLKRQK